MPCFLTCVLDHQLTDDEAYARSLQQEEYQHYTRYQERDENGRNGRERERDRRNRSSSEGSEHHDNAASAPLLEQRRRNENRTIHQNVVASVDDIRAHSPKLYCLFLTTALAEIIATGVILSKTYHADCDKPLAMWVLVYTLRLVLLIPIVTKAFLSVQTEREFRAKVCHVTKLNDGL